MALDWLTGGIGIGSSLLNFGSQMWQNYENSKQNEWSRNFQQQQADLNQQNIETNWQREDTAFQRKNADLEASGMNKSLAYDGSTQGSATSAGGTPQGGGQNPMVMGMQLLEPLQRAMDINNQQRQIDQQGEAIRNQLMLGLADIRNKDAQTRALEHDTAISVKQGLRSNDQKNTTANTIHGIANSTMNNLIETLTKPKKSADKKTMDDYHNYGYMTQ